MEKCTPHVRILGEKRDKLARELRSRYDAGATVRALSKESGRSYGFVHRLVAGLGPMRAKGGSKARKSGA
ncbi:helix-turn-helix domain-containing protein [Kitasatospora sp. NPDC056076]|uniref:helix-turn-helix domain-containing protein n=1 Tax=Kitasatospora sp. NPDC056076 TaxID=3345703 RepID=UPI0035D964D3